MCGYQVDLAGDGFSAVEQILASHPDVALIDVGLPGLDGYGVARAVRQVDLERRPRLIAITGYGQPEDRRRAIDAGFDAHLVKPVDPDSLTRILMEDADGHQAAHHE
jgi:CheY-like chemotaxis protein